MSTRVPLPESTNSRPSPVAEGSDVDHGEGILRGINPAQPSHDVRVPSVTVTTVGERCEAYFPRLRPGQFFSHHTAAALWELPLPSPPSAAENIHVSAIHSSRAPNTRGVTGHQLSASTAPAPEPARWPHRQEAGPQSQTGEERRQRTLQRGPAAPSGLAVQPDILTLAHGLSALDEDCEFSTTSGGAPPHPSYATIMRLRGLPVADPVSVFLSLAHELPLNEVIALGDALVRGPLLRIQPDLDIPDPSHPAPRRTVPDDSMPDGSMPDGSMTAGQRQGNRPPDGNRDDPAHLTERLRPYTTVAELRIRIGSHTGKGKRAALAALPHIRTGVASRPETLLRLLLARPDLPRPRLGLTIRDTLSVAIARAAIAYPEWWVIVEYDGEHALASPDDRAHDLDRFERLMAAGWTVIRVRATGLFRTPESTLNRVASTLRSVGWRR
jgi:hypothetical protein